MQAAALVQLLRPVERAALAGVWYADDPALVATAAECAPSGFAALDTELPGGGWPHGQLVELLYDDPGIGELSLLDPHWPHRPVPAALVSGFCRVNAARVNVGIRRTT